MGGKLNMSINKEEFSIGDLFKKIINSAISKIHTSIPAKIVKLNSNNTVDVIPLIKDKNLKGEYVELPIITNVPVRFFRTKVALISIPMNIDDTGSLSFAERSIKNWQLQGEIQEPEDNRRFNLTDCYFCPDILKDGEGVTFSEDLQIVLKNAKIVIKNDGTINIENTNAKAEFKNDGKITLDNSNSSVIIDNSNVTIESTIIKLGTGATEPVIKGLTNQTLINAFITTFNTHTHLAPSTPPNTPPAIPLTGTELSTKVTVE